MGKLFEIDNLDSEYTRVKISRNWMLQRSMCSEEYIRDVCKGRCCIASSGKFLCSLLPEEVEVQKEKYGKEVVDNKLMPSKETERCPYQQGSGLCDLHFTEDKPFGCIASPFRLNNNGTLIGTHRYVLMACFRKRDSDEGIPYYEAFRASLDMLFGEEEAERIVQEVKKGNENIYGRIKKKHVENLYHLAGIKKTGGLEHGKEELEGDK